MTRPDWVLGWCYSVSALDRACPSGDRDSKGSSWHALIEPDADRPQPVMLGADKGHTSNFVFELREKAVSRK